MLKSRLMKLTAVFALTVMGPGAQALEPEFLISEPADFKAALETRVMPLADWAAGLDREGFDFLCLGEKHENFFRKFYAEKVLSRIATPVLAFEEVDSNLRERLAEFDAAGDEGRLELLGAEASNLVRAARSVNPGVRIVGIEQTRDEARLIEREAIEGRKRLSRDGFIASHVDGLMRESSRVVAVYGALHCSRRSSSLGFTAPFFRLLERKYPEKKLVSVYVVRAMGGVPHPLRVYVDSFELAAKGDIALVGGRGIDPRLYNYRSDIEDLLSSYDVIIFPKR